MSKSSVWNSLKALGYTSEQLKQETGKTYQSANEGLLQSILNKLQPIVVNEVVVTNDAVQDTTTPTEPTVTEHNVPDVSEVITDTAQTTFEVIEQTPLVMPVDDPWLTEQVTTPNDQVTTYKGMPIENFKSKNDSLVSSLLPESSCNDLAVVINKITNPNRIFLGMNWNVSLDIEGILATDNDPLTYSTNNFKRALQIANQWLNDSVTASTVNKVEIPEQVQQPSIVVTEATETINEIEMNNSYSFAFQEVKTPITILEIHSLDNKRIEVINLTNAYFVELRDDKLYVSYGLLIKTFKASDYSIIKAFNYLLNGSNFIKLRDKRENNRDILVNLGRVKTIEQNSKFIKFHWNRLLTYPGYHDLNDWQVID